MPKRNKKIAIRITSIILGVIGIGMLTSVIYPIASHEYISRKQYPILLNPLGETKGIVTANSSGADLTKASNWFPGGASEDEFNASNVKFFTISVPDLNIKQATVAVGGDNLDEHLIQYPGTALPGRIGNAVIFGHSILPIYYDPTNYISIFSTLPTIKKKAEIQVEFDGIRYKYEVVEKFEVLPTDLGVLDQDTDGSYLSLITCTPPGHPQKPKRLVVRAKLVPYETS